MNVIVDFCLVPIGTGVSLSPYVAACERTLDAVGLKTALHANGTNIEGEWDAVFAAIKRCHEIVHGMGAPRITTIIKVGTRTDRQQTMEQKVESVLRKLGTSAPSPGQTGAPLPAQTCCPSVAVDPATSLERSWPRCEY